MGIWDPGIILLSGIYDEGMLPSASCMTKYQLLGVDGLLIMACSLMTICFSLGVEFLILLCGFVLFFHGYMMDMHIDK